MVGGYGDDEFWGGEANDYLYGDLPKEFDQAAKDKSGNKTGKAGDDYLVGGKGNDTLYGGEGYDTYIYYVGDGNDIIIDEDDRGEIIVPGQGKIGNLYRKGNSNIWTDEKGNVKATHNSPWQLVMPDGGTIELGADFKEGDFGVHLLDIPDTPQTGTLITGDLSRSTSMRVNRVCRQRMMRGGTSSRIRTVPLPGRSDFLYDTTGNDRIDGGAGYDYIRARQGGDDWLLGGDGIDFVGSVTATGKDVIEGGAGSDVLAGGPGDDLVFSENYGEMAALIAAGEVAQNIFEKGDLATGNAGNDFVYGSNRGDLLFGGN